MRGEGRGERRGVREGLCCVLNLGGGVYLRIWASEGCCFSLESIDFMDVCFSKKIFFKLHSRFSEIFARFFQNWIDPFMSFLTFI